MRTGKKKSMEDNTIRKIKVTLRDKDSLVTAFRSTRDIQR